MPPDSSAQRHADQELVSRTLGDDADAIEAWTRRMTCVPRMLAARNRSLGGPLDREELLDLVQDTVAILWRKRDQFEGRASLETWAYQVGALEFMNAMRRSLRRRERGAQLPAELPAEVRDDYETEELVLRALEKLGPPESEAIRLRHLEELSFAEAGAALGTSPNTVKGWYYRGMLRLRDILESSEQEGEGAHGS